VDALEAARASITADRERLDSMGERGYERLVERGWTWQAHADRVRELHLEAIE
jgi:hypothetical protein